MVTNVNNTSITRCSTQLTALVWSTLAPALQRASTIRVKPFSLATVRAVAPSWIEIHTTQIKQRIMNREDAQIMLIIVLCTEAVPVSK